MKKVIIHDNIKYSETTIEYTDFEKVFSEYVGGSIEFEFESPEQALTEIINHKKFGAIKLHYRNKIDDIVKPIIYKGIKLDSYFEWNDDVFISMAGFYSYVGKTNE